MILAACARSSGSFPGSAGVRSDRNRRSSSNASRGSAVAAVGSRQVGSSGNHSRGGEREEGSDDDRETPDQKAVDSIAKFDCIGRRVAPRLLAGDRPGILRARMRQATSIITIDPRPGPTQRKYRARSMTARRPPNRYRIRRTAGQMKPPRLRSRQPGSDSNAGTLGPGRARSVFVERSAGCSVIILGVISEVLGTRE